MTINRVPDLPITCLSSANFKRTTEVLEGQNTVIDFWTTKCENCPSALDNLDNLASQSSHADVQFISICCGDKCDGARNIIEENDTPKWGNISHYYMDFENKEIAKEALGFKTVPFYVILDSNGDIVQSGSKRDIDFESIPGVAAEDTTNEEKKSDNVFSMDEDF